MSFVRCTSARVESVDREYLHGFGVWHNTVANLNLPERPNVFGRPVRLDRPVNPTKANDVIEPLTQLLRPLSGIECVCQQQLKFALEPLLIPNGAHQWLGHRCDI